MRDHEYFMGLALAQARIAYQAGEVPVGAVLVTDTGDLLSAAHNSPIGTTDPTAHAEVLALREAARRVHNYRLPGTWLYVTLEPCAMCLGAILQARVATLVFGARDERAGAAGSVVDLTKLPHFNHYVEVVEGIRQSECTDLLRQFFRDRRRERRSLSRRGTEEAVTGSTRNRLVL